jgi:hypothetical protein
MVFDTHKHSTGAPAPLNPMMIAHNALFTAREKMEMLNQLRAEAVVAMAEGNPAIFEPEEIDQAIEEVREDIQRGVGTETAQRGDL